MQHPHDGEVSLGALPSPQDPRDWVFERLAQGPEGCYWATLPDEYDLREHSQPVRKQGDRGTCGAISAAAIKEIQERRDCGFNTYMSPEFIYYHRENKPSSGMYGRNVFQVLQKIGSVPEDMYPYRERDGIAPVPHKRLYKEAKKYRINQYARVDTIDGTKRALIELGPCYMSLPIYRNRPEFWRPAKGEKSSGGHAVAIVGYNKQGFILRNSWGPEWNSDGHVIFPYTDWGLHWECWVSVDDKSPPWNSSPRSRDSEKKTCNIL